MQAPTYTIQVEFDGPTLDSVYHHNCSRERIIHLVKLAIHDKIESGAYLPGSYKVPLGHQVCDSDWLNQMWTDYMDYSTMANGTRKREPKNRRKSIDVDAEDTSDTSDSDTALPPRKLYKNELLTPVHGTARRLKPQTINLLGFWPPKNTSKQVEVVAEKPKAKKTLKRKKKRQT